MLNFLGISLAPFIRSSFPCRDRGTSQLFRIVAEHTDLLSSLFISILEIRKNLLIEEIRMYDLPSLMKLARKDSILRGLISEEISHEVAKESFKK